MVLRQNMLAVLIAAILAPAAIGQANNPIQMSFLPQGRTGEPNTPVTIFGTVINSGDEALDCQPQFGGFLDGLPAGRTGQLRFFPWDGTTITGTANQVVNISAGERQDYVVEANFNGPFTGIVTPNFACTTAGGTEFEAPRRPVVSDLAFNITDSDAPDIILINATLSNDGIAGVGTTGPRSALMTVAAVNIGDAGTNLVAEARITNFRALNGGLDITVCETDGTGVCISAAGRTLDIANWPSNETKLFAVRARIPPAFSVPFYPDILRLAFMVRPQNASPLPDGVESPTEVALGGFGRFGLDWNSTAITAEPHESATINFKEQLPFGIDYSCDTYDPFGFSSIAPMGRISLDPEADFATLLGHIMLRDFDLNTYGQVLSGDLAQGQLTGEYDLTVHGNGNVDQQGNDADHRFVLTVDGPGLELVWQGSAGFRNDLLEDGRVRCAVSPGGIGISSSRSSLDGQFTIDPALLNASQIVFGDTIEVILDDGQRIQLGIELEVAPPSTAETFADDFLSAIRAIAQAEPGNDGEVATPSFETGETVGFFTPLLFQDLGDGTSRVDCMVLNLVGLPATDSDPEAAAQDAGSYILMRNGITFTDEERVQCIP